MSYLKSLRFTLLAALLVTTVIPVYAAKDGPDEDCDGAAGEIATQGTLAVVGKSQLSACVTQTEVRGTLPLTVLDACGRPQGEVQMELELSVKTTTSVCPDGSTRQTSTIDGAARVITKDIRRPNRTFNPRGTIGPSGQLVLIMEDTKTTEAGGVRQACVAGLSGEVLFNPKEYSITAKGSYIGHITIIK